MNTPLSLIHEEEHPPVLRAEFQNILATLQAVLARLGTWVSVSDPSLFSGTGSMSWTVEPRDQVDLAYTLVGSTMLVNLKVDFTTVGGTPNNILQMFLPARKTAIRTTIATCQIFDNSGSTSVLGQIRASKDS